MSASPVKAAVDIGSPSLRLLQTYIREQQQIEIKLLTGDVIAGRLFWQDLDCLCVITAEGQPPTTIWRQAIALIQPLGAGSRQGSSSASAGPRASGSSSPSNEPSTTPATSDDPFGLPAFSPSSDTPADDSPFSFV